MKRFLLYWVLATVGALFIALSLTTVYAADVTSLSKIQSEMLSLTGQLNENCSATLIYSKRDDVTGDVSTIFLTAKHCVSGNKTDMNMDLPVYQGNRIVKKDRYIAGGNSGGAMYHMDAKGDYALLGVTAARARSDSFIGLYTPIEVIHKYLKVALPEAIATGK